jgi:3-isopropylmalate dehydratase small subunit
LGCRTCWVSALCAAARLGAIVVPINARRHPSEVQARLARTGAVVLIVDQGERLARAQSMAPDLPALRHVLAAGTTEFHRLLATAGAPPDVVARPQDPGDRAHHRQHWRAARRGARAPRVGAQRCRDVRGVAGDARRRLLARCRSNRFGITATILSTLVAGARLAALPMYHPGAALELIARERVTIHNGVPTLFALELNHSSFRSETCAGLRTGIMAGAYCPPELITRVRDEMGCHVLVAYGLTEAAPGVCITRLDDGPVTATQTVGRPMEGVEVKVVDAAGALLPPGEVGELCVRGYNVMQGYWNDAEATAQALDADGWLRTGDLASVDADGPVRIVGRVREVINRAGLKIYPGTVEMVLRAYPGVKEAAVVGVPDRSSANCPTPASYAAGRDRRAEGCWLTCAEHLAEYAVPYRVLFFETLPRRDSGAVDKGYLRERVRRRGHAWKFGKNVDTDAIIPARHCNTADPKELAKHCMEDADAEFVRRMRRGDVIVAESNFGCGSSREVAPISIKAAGVSAVIARSFARIFFRNAINIGLPILECRRRLSTHQAATRSRSSRPTGRSAT